MLVIKPGLGSASKSRNLLMTITLRHFRDFRPGSQSSPIKLDKGLRRVARDGEGKIQQIAS
jgi:hypothetical protein